MKTETDRLTWLTWLSGLSWLRLNSSKKQTNKDENRDRQTHLVDLAGRIVLAAAGEDNSWGLALMGLVVQLQEQTVVQWAGWRKQRPLKQNKQIHHNKVHFTRLFTLSFILQLILILSLIHYPDNPPFILFVLGVVKSSISNEYPVAISYSSAALGS